MKRTLARRQLALDLPAPFKPTGLVLPEGTTFQEWLKLGEFLRAVEGRVMWWIGDWWRFGEKRHKWGTGEALAAQAGLNYQSCLNAGWVAGRIEFSRRLENLSWNHHQEVADLTPAEQDRWLRLATTQKWGVHELRRQIKIPGALPVPDPPEGEYRCIVVDPPWPMDKSERTVRPHQAAPLDYWPMPLDELRALRLPAAADSHLYLWTTQRFVPAALELAEAWGFSYHCMLTWIKNVGFTPYSWMYSTEHVVFARRGALELLVKGRRLDFSAKVRQHSRKPDEFYDLVREVSPGPRLDMFSREARDGFAQWGNEPARFGGAPGDGLSRSS
jgi:N6-adenosine-specific RNA methylase IME4